MSRFKVGDNVIVKATNEVGVIKGRDTVDTKDGKIRIEYIVKTGNGFDKWGSYSKKELKRVSGQYVQKKPSVVVVDAPNGYKVTLVGVVTPKDFYDYSIYFYRKGKELNVGYSIYNPEDEYDYEYGVKKALHRAKRESFCHMESDFNGEFNEETVNAILRVKGEYIVRNIEKFINK